MKMKKDNNQRQISIRQVFTIAAIALASTIASRCISFTSFQEATTNDIFAYSLELASPKTAASRLQDPKWTSQLSYQHLGGGRRIIEWSVNSVTSQQNHGIELILMPFERRSSALIDLFLKGHVEKTMGENVAMLGWAKTALALGCERVLMFDSYEDFVRHVDKASKQVYILDYLSIPQLKDQLLLDTELTQRTWEFAYWGRSQEDVRTILHLSNDYGFKNDHALVPFNLTGAPLENVRMALLPTAITMNHLQSSVRVGTQTQCDVFFMGKSTENIERSIPLIKLVEEKLLERGTHSGSVTLCSAFQTQSSLEKILGFAPKYTVNVGRMKPTQFASLVGNAKVVVGSGSPKCSPTIIDAIFGGAVFMAPSEQFCSMEMHPLFIKSDKSFHSLEEEAEKIVEILHDESREQLSFGGFNDTSYSIENVCQQLLGVIHKSFSNVD